MHAYYELVVLEYEYKRTMHNTYLLWIMHSLATKSSKCTTS